MLLYASLRKQDSCESLFVRLLSGDTTTMFLQHRQIGMLLTLVGTLTILTFNQPAVAEPTQGLITGFTSVQLSTDFVSALGSLGVQAKPLRNARLKNGTAAFVISGGAIDLGTISTEIIHKGGLSLSAGETVVELTDFLITTLNGAPALTGLATVNGTLAGRLPLFSLALTQSPVVAPRIVSISNVGVTLTPEAAAALNQAFGVTAFTPGFNIGMAQVRGVLGQP
jgi:hypothetical protein